MCEYYVPFFTFTNQSNRLEEKVINIHVKNKHEKKKDIHGKELMATDRNMVNISYAHTLEKNLFQNVLGPNKNHHWETLYNS